MKRQLLTLILFCTTLMAGSVSAQTVLQVVTKTIEEKLPYKKGYELNIEAEKADIQLTAWDKNYIGLTMAMSAKHPDKKTAETDLETMRYVAEKIGRKVYIRNYVAIQKGAEKPLSNFNTKYIIYVPAQCLVHLNNYIGSARVSNLKGGLHLNSEFCTIELDNITGELDLTTRFGDVNGRMLSGNVQINSQRSDIVLDDLKGAFDIRARYGTIWVNADESLVDMAINARKSDVHLVPARTGNYRYALKAEYGKITVPDVMNFDFTERSEALQQAELQPSAQRAMVNIVTSFGDIFIGSERNP